MNKPKAMIKDIAVWCNHDQLVDIDKLVPYPRNPNIHPQHQIDALAKIIKYQGFRTSITVSKRSGFIIRGHGRLMAAKKLELPQVPVDFQDYENEAAEWADLIADNKISELASMDDVLLHGLMADIKLADFDMELTGFSSDELDEMFKGDESGGEGLTDPDQVPDPPAEPKSKLGDLYQLGQHRLLCGDSTKREDVERLMGGKKADMVFTDPPYGVSYADKNTFLNEIDKGNRNQKRIENDHQSEKDIQIFWKEAFEIIRDNLTEVNSYYITGPQIQGMMMMMMMMMMQEAGLPYRHVIIWVKNNHVLGRCDYNYKHEPIFFGWTKTHKFYGKGSFQTSVWEVDKPLKNDLHPIMKPIALIENALLNSSKVDHICFDPFGGSGSTLIACEKTGRQCRMMEIDPLYVDVIITRWEDYTGRKAVKL